MLRRFTKTLLLILTTGAVYAQTGIIKGSVKDAKNGEAIIGANILVLGTSQGAAADVNGDFEIEKVKTGTYTLVVSFISYATDTLKNITVYPDQATLINTTLREEGQQLQELIVRGTKVTNTDVSVISEIKKNDLVVVGISAQQISMSQDRDAAQIMKRLPGITIVGNRFINVRGLSERYSTVMLNGIIAPSSETDSKAFSFDLIPSGLIDRMMVYKSGAADLPGEFAGAVVGIYTKNVVEENSTSLTVSGSFRGQTTGSSMMFAQQHGKKDWLGMDDGTRGLPSSFPSQNLRALDYGNQNEQNILLQATKSIPNNWASRNVTASPDFRVNFDLARTVRLGTFKIDNITSINYAHLSQRYEATQNNYGTYSDVEHKSPSYFRFKDRRYFMTNRIGAISNFTFHISPTHRIEFRNFYSQQGQDQSTVRTGFDDTNQVEVNNLMFNYQQRGLYSGQLSGKHALSNALNFNWIFGYSDAISNQPDYRRITSQRTTGSTDPFTINIAPAASLTDAGHFYSKLNEKTYSATGHLEIKLNPSAESERQTKLLAGYYLEQKDRDFSARWMSYKWVSPGAVDLSLLSKPFTEIFVDQNLGSKFILAEGTNVGPDRYDAYQGKSTLTAGFLNLTTPIGAKFRLATGLRIENNVQKINVHDENNKLVNLVNRPFTVPMPFANVSYNFTEKMLVRFAYARTVNRPVFREMSPFLYYDFDRNATIIGNPLIATATVHNLDTRWELYPSKQENISFGVFYKRFKNPIEQILLSGGNPYYTFANADAATNYGAEVEVRKSLASVANNFVNKLTFVFNGALIKSRVELPKAGGNLVNRPLQGQSPYVLNTSVYYNDFERGLQVSLQYNVFGRRIFAAGDKDTPDQWEMPRNQIDLTVSKQLGKHAEIKFGVQDLLNARYRIILDSNHDQKIKKYDESFSTYRLGTYVTGGVVWKF